MLTQAKVVVLLLKASSRRLLGSARNGAHCALEVEKNKGLTREQTKRAMLSWGGLFKNYDGDPACFKENEFARSLDRAYLGVSTNPRPNYAN